MSGWGKSLKNLLNFFTRASYSGLRNQNQSAKSISLINKKELSQFKDTINNLQDNHGDNEDYGDYEDKEIDNEYNEIENEESEGQSDEDQLNADGTENHQRARTGSTKDVKRLVDRIVDNDDRNSNMNGLIPSSANEMSSTAQIRFLKAKLKVMQEEVDRFSTELTKKVRRLNN